MQMGGSDQWGNIVNGVELIKRHSSKQVFGLTTPLITLSSGSKMGKTEKGAIWLDKKLLSSYDYWQFWRNTDDRDVLRFIKMFTDLTLKKIEEIKNHLKKCDGVMIGRAIYQNPYFLVDIEREIFNVKNHPTREEITEELLKYLEKEVKLGTKVNHIMRHTVGLYHGQIGSKNWKRYLSDNMMARDSDFQKAKHIMTIVQNNEKINQTIA